MPFQAMPGLESKALFFRLPTGKIVVSSQAGLKISEEDCVSRFSYSLSFCSISVLNRVWFLFIGNIWSNSRTVK